MPAVRAPSRAAREPASAGLPLEDTGLDALEETCAADSDPLTPQRRGFIDTFFSPWNSLRSALTHDKVRRHHAATAELPRRNAGGSSSKQRHKRPGGSQAAPRELNRNGSYTFAAAFGGLPLVAGLQDARRNRKLPPHPRRACVDGWLRWVLGLCKCHLASTGGNKPGGGQRNVSGRSRRRRVGSKRRRCGNDDGAPPAVRLLAIHQEGHSTSGSNVFVTPGGDRYLSNGWRLSPAPASRPFLLQRDAGVRSTTVQGQGQGRGLQSQGHGKDKQVCARKRRNTLDCERRALIAAAASDDNDQKQEEEEDEEEVDETLGSLLTLTHTIHNALSNTHALSGVFSSAGGGGGGLENKAAAPGDDAAVGLHHHQQQQQPCTEQRRPCYTAGVGVGGGGGSSTLRLVQECRRRQQQRRPSERARLTALRLTKHLLVPAMLQQILKDMYIDPELLAELDDEQKQILFCKLREEQVRRWKEREAKLEEEEKRRPKKPKPPGKNGKRNIGWKLGADNQVWVWVMGDHRDDPSVEEILEREAQERARRLAEQEAEALAKRQEEELSRNLQEERERVEEALRRRQEELRKKAELERLEEEKKKQEEEKQEQMKLLRVKHEYQRRKSIDEINEMKQRRSSELYMSFKETRQTIEKLAEEDSKTIETEWQEQQKKSKAAEQEIRAIARRAREEHRKSMTDTLRTRAQIIGKMAAGLQDVRATGEKPPVPTKPASLKLGRPPKPPNKKAIIDWYKEVEYPKNTGLNPSTKQVEPWFHGIITRQEAEDLLESESTGTFLIRVSERIWGYAVSYRGDARCKHFLIDAANDNYQFFGTHQIAHSNLADLINFHKVTPISNSGQEKLLRPCKQKQEPPNYHELIPAMKLINL